MGKAVPNVHRCPCGSRRFREVWDPRGNAHVLRCAKCGKSHRKTGKG